MISDQIEINEIKKYQRFSKNNIINDKSDSKFTDWIIKERKTLKKKNEDGCFLTWSEFVCWEWETEERALFVEREDSRKKNLGRNTLFASETSN